MTEIKYYNLRLKECDCEGCRTPVIIPTKFCKEHTPPLMAKLVYTSKHYYLTMHTTEVDSGEVHFNVWAWPEAWKGHGHLHRVGEQVETDSRHHKKRFTGYMRKRRWQFWRNTLRQAADDAVNFLRELNAQAIGTEVAKKEVQAELANVLAYEQEMDSIEAQLA